VQVHSGPQAQISPQRHPGRRSFRALSHPHVQVAPELAVLAERRGASRLTVHIDVRRHAVRAYHGADYGKH